MTSSYLLRLIGGAFLLAATSCNQQDIRDATEILIINPKCPSDPVFGSEECIKFGVDILPFILGGGEGPVSPTTIAGVSTDTRGSSPQLSPNAQAAMTIKLVSQSGAILGSKSFAGKRVGSRLYAADPIAIAYWINSTGISYYKITVETVISGIVVVEGLNTFMVTTQYEGVDIETAGVIWTSDSCDTPPDSPPSETDCI